MLLPHHPLSLWSLQGAVIANELGQYRLEVSLALTQEEGNQMLSELVGRDRAESVRNVTKIPLFSPNSLIFLNLCFVILFRSPSLR